MSADKASQLIESHVPSVGSVAPTVHKATLLPASLGANLTTWMGWTGHGRHRTLFQRSTLPTQCTCELWTVPAHLLYISIIYRGPGKCHSLEPVPSQRLRRSRSELGFLSLLLFLASVFLTSWITVTHNEVCKLHCHLTWLSGELPSTGSFSLLWDLIPALESPFLDVQDPLLPWIPPGLASASPQARAPLQHEQM